MKLPKGFDLIVPPKGEYQIEAIGHGVIHDDPALLLGLGLGKTYCSLQIARYRIQQSGVKKVLILAPSTLLYTWKKKGVDWCTEYNSIVLHAKQDERVKLIKEFEENKNIQFGIINYEALDTFGYELSKIPIDMIIADESARFIKNIEAKRTQATIWFGDRSKYNIILTGKLITKRPLNIWSQYRFLDRGATFGTNFERWKHYFFQKRTYRNFEKWEIREDKIEQLHNYIYSIAISFGNEVREDRNESIFTNVILKREDVEPFYSEIEESVIADIETELGNVRVNTTNIFTKLIRLQQLTAGFVNDNGKIKYLKHTPKLDAIMDEVESILEEEESIIIWCRFHPSLKLICDTLKEKDIKYIQMSGKDSPIKKDRKWREYQQSKKIDVFVGQIEAGGIGIELFKIDSKDKYQHTLYFEKTWVMDDYEQSVGRTDRLGQNSICRYVDFIVEGTIDEKIESVIQNDQNIANLIMNKGIRKFLQGG